MEACREFGFDPQPFPMQVKRYVSVQTVVRSERIDQVLLVVIGDQQQAFHRKPVQRFIR